MSRMRPPLTTSMTVPVTMPSSSLIFSIVPQARSYCARFLDRIRRPSLSSFWRTRASTSSPTDDDLVGVDVVLDRQLARGDDALGLVADVEQDLVAVDLDDDALDDVAVVEVLDRLVDRGEEVLFGADVVDRDLREVGASMLAVMWCRAPMWTEVGRDVSPFRRGSPPYGEWWGPGGVRPPTRPKRKIEEIFRRTAVGSPALPGAPPPARAPPPGGRKGDTRGPGLAQPRCGSCERRGSHPMARILVALASVV